MEWKRNKVYKYEVKAKTLTSLAGLYYRLHLTLRPQSDDVIIGRVTDAEFAYKKAQLNNDESSSDYSDANDRNFEDTPLSKPFKINLRNGVIRSLGVDNSVSPFELDQLKLIMSQFQIDKNGENMRDLRRDNEVRQMNDNSAFYKTFEPTANGQCETVYDISRIPSYLLKSHPEWVPMPRLDETREGVSEIVKTKNSASCSGRGNTLAAVSRLLPERDVNENDLSIVEKQRIVVSGSLERFTFQSARTAHKIMHSRRNAPLLGVYVKTTLESVESSFERSVQDLPSRWKIVENLMFDFVPPPQQERLCEYIEKIF